MHNFAPFIYGSMQTSFDRSSLKAWIQLSNAIMPVVLFTYVIRKLILFFASFVATGRLDSSLFLDELTLRSGELDIISGSILKLEAGQQYYFGEPGIDEIFPHLGHIFLLAWQLNVVMKWAQFKLLGKDSGLKGVFTPIIDLGTFRLFFMMGLPVVMLWFFNPLVVMHPLAYPYSLVHYFNETSNSAGMIVLLVAMLILINLPIVARLTGAPGLIVHGKSKVIDSVAGSFRIISTVSGLKVATALLTLGVLALYISSPGSVFQFPVADQLWLQWLIKGFNILSVTFIWSLIIAGMTGLYYRNIKTLERYS